jgi:hypothetical protein
MLTTTPYTEAIREAKRRVIFDALRQTGGNRTHAASALGITRHHLTAQIRTLEIDVPVAPRATWSRGGRRPKPSAEAKCPACDRPVVNDHDVRLPQS